jgi:hypothetical protein
MDENFIREGDGLVSSIVSCGDRSYIGEQSIKLLDMIFSGYPAARLRGLITSANDLAAAEGAWILTEIGQLGAFVTDILPVIVHHRNYVVRYWGVDLLILHVSRLDVNEFCMCIGLLTDAHQAVREYAILQYARLELDATARFRQSSKLAPQCRNIIDAIAEEDTARIVQLLYSEDVGVRSAAAAAAFRSGSSELSSALEICPDDTIRRMAVGRPKD